MWLLAADSAAGNAAAAAGAAELEESGFTSLTLKCIPEYIEIRRSSLIEAAL